MDLNVSLPKTPRIGELVTIDGNKSCAYMWNGKGWQTIRKPLILDRGLLENPNQGRIGLHKKITVDVLNESPTGETDGENKLFLLEHKPVSGTENFYLNGQVLNREDYDIVENTILFEFAPFPGSSIICTYSTLTYTEVFNETPIGAVDGVNDTFTLFSTPVQNSDSVYLNGVRIEKGNDKDYIIINNILKLFLPPSEKSSIKVDYHAII